MLGCAEQTVVNAGADGAKSVLAKRGVFKFFNAAADAVAAGDVGKDCYILDDQTVAKTNPNSTRAVAGIVQEVDADGVWVDVSLTNSALAA